ncbi:putative membrane protein [Lewinella marina]|uniref:DUF4199 domain-containing protein n=1 Tax=Neolewinella marina TaxID=438751 RepID=A0A2G0CH55_9BACT|nr:hypothetical protein [Neolewinella marina]NJB86219.1 putative membrane protein [Neolewinella marina]PHK99306.1 hypothetical protein CGL56_07580 [Neolewinella marina]
MKTIALKFGFYFFGGLVAIFLLSYLLGYAANYQLRMVNGFLHMAILYYGIRELRIRQPDTHQNYVSGVAQGLFIGAVGTVMFSIFTVLFLIAAPNLMAELQAATPLGNALTPVTAGVIILMEGVAVSLIGSYLLTRYVDARIEKKAGAESAYTSRGSLVG